MIEDKNETSGSFLKNENHSSLAVLLLRRASRLMAEELYTAQNSLAAEDREPHDRGCSLWICVLVLSIHRCTAQQQRVAAVVGTG